MCDSHHRSRAGTPPSRPRWQGCTSKTAGRSRWCRSITRPATGVHQSLTLVSFYCDDCHTWAILGLHTKRHPTPALTPAAVSPTLSLSRFFPTTQTEQGLYSATAPSAVQCLRAVSHSGRCLQEVPARLEGARPLPRHHPLQVSAKSPPPPPVPCAKCSTQRPATAAHCLCELPKRPLTALSPAPRPALQLRQDRLAGPGPRLPARLSDASAQRRLSRPGAASFSGHTFGHELTVGTMRVPIPILTQHTQFWSSDMHSDASVGAYMVHGAM